MKVNGDNVLFESTGREDYANLGIIGISPKLETYGGYDQGLPMFLSVEDEERGYTEVERRELAEHMIALWKKYGGIE